MYEEAPYLRPGPRVMTRAQAQGDRVVLSIVNDFLAHHSATSMTASRRSSMEGSHESGAYTRALFSS